MNRKTPSLFATAIALPITALALLIAGCASLQPTTSAIDPDAKVILEQASQSLSAAQTFSFRVRRNVPAQIAEAAGMEKKADIRVSVQRPNKVRAVNGSGKNATQFYYDGATITRYDAGKNTYASAQAPATIDAMLTFLDKEWNLRPPLAGLLVNKPFASAIHKSRSGKLVGKESIKGESCHHLTLTGDGVIWDLWISTKDHLPRRFDVTVTELKGSPRGVTTLSDWDLDDNFSDHHFRAVLPDGATQTKMEEMR